MAKYKSYDYSQSLLIPISLQEQLMLGTLEFAIHSLVEGRMDMSVFEDNYQNDETGRKAYDPKLLLKVVLLAYIPDLIFRNRDSHFSTRPRNKPKKSKKIISKEKKNEKNH
ncbi:MAG: hypothetical protein KJO26_12085 [Deltaproteobacteria bacterium]|nr:hypothetical protein [Deltaproteobacteria bacterium]